MIDHAEMLKFISYNSETGKMFWISSYCNNIKVGEEFGTDVCSKGITYRAGRILGQRIYCHVLAWFYYWAIQPEGQIDHINGNTLDNRMSNLREVSVIENSYNKKKKTTAAKLPLGVYFHKHSGRYPARIRVNKVNYFLGVFDTPEEAGNAYVKASVELHGSLGAILSRKMPC